MVILRKYGVATHVYVPIVKRAVVDFAVGADWTPAAGDVKISKDGGAAANIGTLPTAIAMGNTAYWDFTISATEMEAAKIIITVADSATKVVEDQAILIDTYGHASGEHAFDLDTAVQSVDVASISGDSAAADNCESFFDGTGYVGGTIRLKIDAAMKKNTALSAFQFFMIDSADNVSGKTGLTVTATRSIDGGAFASCANSPTEISAGLYKIDLAASDLNGNVITLKFTATGALATIIQIVTNP